MMSDVTTLGKQVRRTNKERSEATRTRLLEATVACLYEHGYAATTGTLAIQRAGLSRGAALHQFPSRVELLLATALYIIDWLNEYRLAQMRQLRDRKQRLIKVTDIVWDSWRQPHSIALLEIFIGARSDPELSERLPAIRQRIQQDQLDKFWEICQAAGAKPQHREKSDRLALMGIAVMRGLAIERMSSRDPALIERAFELFKEVRIPILESMLED